MEYKIRIPRNFLLKGKITGGDFDLYLDGEKSSVQISRTGSKIRLREVKDTRVVYSKQFSLATELNSESTLAIVKFNDYIECFIDNQHVGSLPVSWQRFRKFYDSNAAQSPVMTQVKTQKISKVFFSDDFMRNPEEPTPWNLSAGKWEIHSIVNPTRSANAFSCSSSGEKAVALAGKKFWRDYTLTCAVQPIDADSLGVFINYLDEKNHYKVEWAKAPDNHLRLIKVYKGRETVLARRYLQMLSKNWYKMQALSSYGQLSVTVDGMKMIQTYDPHYLSNGQIGLWSRGGEKGVNWDDVVAEGVKERVYDFTSPWSLMTEATKMSTRFPAGITSKGLPFSAANKKIFIYGMNSDTGRVNLELAGMNNFSKLPNTWLFKLYLRHYDSENNIALKVSKESSQLKAVLYKVNQGQSMTLSEKSFELDTELKKLTLHLDREIFMAFAGKHLVGYASLPVESFDGLVAVSANAKLSDLVISKFSFSKQNEFEALRKNHYTFSREESMKAWSRPASDWSNTQFTKFNYVHWHRSDFWSDYSINVDLKKYRESFKQNQFAMTISGGKLTWDKNFYRLGFWKENQNNKKVKSYENTLKLGYGADVIKSVEISPSAKTMNVKKVGKALIVSVDKNVVLDYHFQEDLEKPYRMGVWIDAFKKNWSEMVNVHAKYVRTYSFDKAPVDWRVSSGNWEVTNRWQCDPRWSFFAGFENKSTSLIWYKFKHRKNLTLEFFVGPKMDSQHNPSYKKVGNWNAVLCGDGMDVISGYNFMIGGWGNTGTYIVKNEKPLTWTRHRISTRGIHRKWFHVKIRKFDTNMKIWYDGELVAEGDDQKIKDAGFLGLWTYKGGVMIAQVRISTQDQVEPAIAPSFIPETPITPYSVKDKKLN